MITLRAVLIKKLIQIYSITEKVWDRLGSYLNQFQVRKYIACTAQQDRLLLVQSLYHKKEKTTNLKPVNTLIIQRCFIRPRNLYLPWNQLIMALILNTLKKLMTLWEAISVPRISTRHSFRFKSIKLALMKQERVILQIMQMMKFEEFMKRLRERRRL